MTDPFRQCNAIAIVAVDDRTCALSALRQPFGERPCPVETSLLIMNHHELAPRLDLDVVANQLYYAEALHSLQFQAAIQATISAEELPLQPECRP